MLTLQRFLLVCALLVVALAAPAPISPSRSGIWLLTNAQKLSLTARSRDALHNASLRRNIFKSLRKTDPPTSAAAVPSRHSLDAFLQAHNTVRRAHAFKPKEQKMSRPNVAALAGWFTDHQSIQSKIASQTKFPALNMASIPHSNLQNTRTLKTKMGQQSGRKAAPLGTSKDLAGLFRTSLPIANRMGLTGDTCTSTSECTDGRLCVDIANEVTCSSGEGCICVPTDGAESCTSSDDCSTAGEVCVQGNESTLCFSEEAVNAGDNEETSTTGGTGSGGGSGLTGDTCTSTSECADGRLCVDIANEVTCSSGEGCICVPTDGAESCTSSDDCSTAGEVCVQGNESTLCFSEEAVNAGDNEETSTTGGTGSGGGSGLTGDTCTSTSECADGRLCVDIANEVTCSSSEGCICVPTDGAESCTSSDDCSTAGEVCVQGNESTLCFSEEAVNAGDNEETSTTGGTGSGGGVQETPTAGDGDSESEGSITNPDGLDVPPGGNDDEDDVCIDVRALGHLSSNGLVFEKHAVSRVLCDENDSCATRGHMVVFRGHAMRMSTYCESVGCKEAVMEVNSPRFKRGMRIESNTKGLEYTAFAARYDTQAEESLIRMAVRFGL
ncbi:unnamed protein product [Chondrus crispus]|uniref:SCP domain-containing protein n=1 Tax=Chondrus crispus TaxID=2769 RepID=R7QS06_CHOCR|nr:unnamed protein product [Chondrus crispus]CDF40909.1 unnamed protein product [Chondrus crispus]|eukprot:XP_005711203.1 unnamed protein product [Chondrus crispus]